MVSCQRHHAQNIKNTPPPPHFSFAPVPPPRHSHSGPNFLLLVQVEGLFFLFEYIGCHFNSSFFIFLGLVIGLFVFISRLAESSLTRSSLPARLTIQSPHSLLRHLRTDQHHFLLQIPLAITPRRLPSLYTPSASTSVSDCCHFTLFGCWNIAQTLFILRPPLCGTPDLSDVGPTRCI